MPRATAVCCRWPRSSWLSFSSAPARLICRPSTSPSQPSVSASAIRAIQPGAQCAQLGTSVAADVLHKARLKLLDHLLVADATRCESCGAEPGQVCRTTSGKDATAPHAARVRAAAALNAAARDSQNR
ncbi:zinc finger domain-containing protein [Streptomyces justiciae]